MFSLEGVPAIYIHSLFGSTNDTNLYTITKQNRSLNRGKININEIMQSDLTDPRLNIFNEIKRLLSIRKKQLAFNPNAVQFTLHLGKELYGIWRQSLDKTQNIFCVSNLTHKETRLSLLDLNLSSFSEWFDLLSDRELEDISQDLTLKPYQTVWLSNLKN